MTRTKRHRLATATREEVSREGSLDQFRGQGSSRGAFHRAAQLGIIAVGASERASYNGSIEASQASDVGSIPIARSNKTGPFKRPACFPYFPKPQSEGHSA